MLTLAMLGMLAYGVSEAGSAFFDLFFRQRLEAVADVARLAFAVLLMLAAPLVRVRLPGGLALAIGAMLGLQALALHESVHLYGDLRVRVQIARGLLTALLIALAYDGARRLPD